MLNLRLKRLEAVVVVLAALILHLLLETVLALLKQTIQIQATFMLSIPCGP